MFTVKGQAVARKAMDSMNTGSAASAAIGGASGGGLDPADASANRVMDKMSARRGALTFDAIALGIIGTRSGRQKGVFALTERQLRKLADSVGAIKPFAAKDVSKKHNRELWRMPFEVVRDDEGLGVALYEQWRDDDVKVARDAGLSDEHVQLHRERCRLLLRAGVPFTLHLRAKVWNRIARRAGLPAPVKIVGLSLNPSVWESPEGDPLVRDVWFNAEGFKPAAPAPAGPHELRPRLDARYSRHQAERIVRQAFTEPDEYPMQPYVLTLPPAGNPDDPRTTAALIRYVMNHPLTARADADADPDAPVPPTCTVVGGPGKSLALGGMMKFDAVGDREQPDAGSVPCMHLGYTLVEGWAGSGSPLEHGANLNESDAALDVRASFWAETMPELGLTHVRHAMPLLATHGPNIPAYITVEVRVDKIKDGTIAENAQLCVGDDPGPATGHYAQCGASHGRVEGTVIAYAPLLLLYLCVNGTRLDAAWVRKRYSGSAGRRNRMTQIETFMRKRVVDGQPLAPARPSECARGIVAVHEAPAIDLALNAGRPLSDTGGVPGDDVVFFALLAFERPTGEKGAMEPTPLTAAMRARLSEMGADEAQALIDGKYAEWTEARIAAIREAGPANDEEKQLLELWAVHEKDAAERSPKETASLERAPWCVLPELGSPVVAVYAVARDTLDEYEAMLDAEAGAADPDSPWSRARDAAPAGPLLVPSARLPGDHAGAIARAQSYAAVEAALRGEDDLFAAVDDDAAAAAAAPDGDAAPKRDRPPAVAADDAAAPPKSSKRGKKRSGKKSD